MNAPFPDLAPPGGWTDDLRVADIQRLRASIDNVDAAFVHLMAERFKLTGAVGRHKAALGWPTSTRDREDEQKARLSRLAESVGLDPAFQVRFLDFVVGEVLKKHSDQRRPTTAEAPRPVAVTIPVLETERLWLRALQLDDFAVVGAFFADPEATRHIGGPRDAVGAWRMMAALVGHWALHGFGPLGAVEKTSGELVGWVGPWFPADNPEREIMWSIRPAHQRRGYGAEAARRMLDFVHHECGWTSAVSYVAEANTASRRLAESLGATLEGSVDVDGWQALVYRHRPPAIVSSYPKSQDPTSGVK